MSEQICRHLSKLWEHQRYAAGSLSSPEGEESPHPYRVVRFPPRATKLVAALVLGVVWLFLAGTPGQALLLWDDPSELSVSDASEPSADYEDLDDLARRIDTEVLPIPAELQPSLLSLRARGGSGWSSFRTPFPSVPVWNPPGPLRVGLQAGHWLYNESPDELADLRRNPGTSGGGLAEWEVNLDIAQRAAALLRAAGIEVDLLPTTVPVRYRAHLFVTVHADGDVTGILNGFKVARPGFSSIPEVDNALVEALNQEYGLATGLPRRDAQVSMRMLYYYAFNARRYQHAVAPGVPQAIVETGFLTNWSDRGLLIGDPDRAAQGIANGVMRFLRQRGE